MTKSIGYLPYEAVVAEMSADGLSDLVPVDKELLAGVIDPTDDNPVFVTIEVLNEGRTNNGREWTKEHLIDIANQINASPVDGYMGHLPQAERSHKTPETVTLWLGATVKEVQGKVRLFAKGYVLPYAANLRSYLRSSKAVKKNVSVSVYGVAKNAVKSAKGVIPNGFMLESIDWARAKSAGITNSLGFFQVTAEMTDDSEPNLTPEEETSVNKEDILKAATKSDLEAHNPTLITEMTQDAVQAKEVELEQVVSEMTAITDLVGDKPLEVIAEMQSKLRESELSTALADKVQSPQARKAIKHLVVSEMTADTALSPTDAVDKVLQSDDGKHIVQEMIDAAPVVAPRIDREGQVAERTYTKKSN